MKNQQKRNFKNNFITQKEKKEEKSIKLQEDNNIENNYNSLKNRKIIDRIKKFKKISIKKNKYYITNNNSYYIQNNVSFKMNLSHDNKLKLNPIESLINKTIYQNKKNSRIENMNKDNCKCL